MAIADATTVAQKWANRASAASGDYRAGVENTQKDPTALAIAAGPKYIQRVTQAYQDGRYTRGLQRAGKAGWLEGVLNKGVNNYSAGVTASVDKFAARIAPVLAYENSGLGQLAGMPNVTDADSEARMLFWTRYMRAYKTNR